MPSASRTVTIVRPPADVFAFIADGTTAPQWRSGVTDVSLQSGTGLGARYRQGVKGPGGRRVDADHEVTAFERDRRLAFAATAGPVRPTGEYRLEPIDGGTRLTFSLHAAVGGLKDSADWSRGAVVHGCRDGRLDRLKAVLEGHG
jgi:uncharacterized protein YndB with AHSA1/START domain